MRILFAGGNGYLPEMSGGVQSSTDHLVRQCLAAGHEAAVLAALFGDGRFGIRARARLKLSRKPVVADRRLGYEVMRAWFPWDAAGHVCAAFRPDVALVQCHKAVKVGAALSKAGVPIVVYLRNVEYGELEGDPRTLAGARYIANSRFTAAAYREAFGLESTVIPPTIDPARYKTHSTRECVTFINCYPEKGFDVAVEVARACAEIPFQFVESWRLVGEQLATVERRLGELPNARFVRRTDDMRAIYGRTKILLAPSQWEEAWGRVASEAQCSALPVLGSARGGLPEAIGPGGTILPHDAPASEWADALRNLWHDEATYARLSDAARIHAARDDLKPQHQFACFMQVLEGAAAPIASAA